LLGGPFAAAVLAKYATSTQADMKPSASPGDAEPSQLLTSTAGYGAKKLLPQIPPTLSSVIPAAAMPEEHVEVFGHNLSVQATVKVFVGTVKATVVAHDLVLGNDRLTVVVPAEAKPGSAPITVVRADGVQARDANGVTALPFEVLARPTEPNQATRDA
jgi:hypothetical protein